MRQTLLTIVITLAAVFVLVSPLWRSGVFDEQGNLLFDGGATFYDAGVHLSLIGEMQHRFPPTNFAFGGASLKNYHYFYDLLLAGIVKISHVSYLDLYYRFAPIALSVLLSMAIYLTTFTLTKNRLTASLAIFFTVFGTSFGALTMRGTNNVFMTDQIYDMMVNPQGVLSLIVFLSLFLLLNTYEKSRKRFLMFLFAGLLAVSFGIKAHGGVVFAAGASFCAIWLLFRNRDYFAGLMTLLGLGGLGVWVLANLDGSAVGIKFAPLWLLDRLMGDYERLYRTDYYQQIENARFAQSWLHLIVLYVQAFMVYLFGSMGLRLLGLLPALSKIESWRKISIAEAFLFSCGAVSFLIPVFFYQGVKPFDIIQFTPYFTLLSGIGFTIVVCSLLAKVRYRTVRLLVLVGLAVIFLFLDKREILARRNYLSYDRVEVRQTPDGEFLRGNQRAIMAPVVEAMDYINRNTSPEAIFLLAPTKSNLGTLWFSAIAGRRTVYSGEFFPFQVGLDVSEAKNHLLKIFSAEWVDPEFDFVFLRRSEMPEFGKIIDKYRLRPVFENKEALVLKR